MNTEDDELAYAEYQEPDEDYWTSDRTPFADDDELDAQADLDSLFSAADTWTDDDYYPGEDESF